ncbi:MAG: sigma-54 dependent transcriptional regulator [Planctomycetota bacterium]
MSDQAKTATVLVVDDDAAVCWALERVVTDAGWKVVIAADAASARKRIKSSIDVVVTDIRMPGESGLDLLTWLKSEHPDVPVIVMTAHGTMATAVAAVARGAFDYLPKPLDLERTQSVLRRALGETPLAASARPARSFDEDGIIGSSAAMQDVYRRLAAAAASDVEVLFTGPAGCGKETLAHALHRHSTRSSGPFIHVGCSSLTEAHAVGELKGRFESATGGILFLDEVDSLPAGAQEFLASRLTATRATGSGARVIAATRRDLQSLVAAGSFRDDLAWRLRTVHIPVPALTERSDDLEPLVRAFILRAAGRLSRSLSITDAALARIRRHGWPGNVRELKHALEEAAVLAVGGVIDAEHLPLPEQTGDPPSADSFANAVAGLARRLMDRHPGEVHTRAMDALDAALLREALARTTGNQLRAAELLGINRATLKKRMDQLGIDA